MTDGLHTKTERVIAVVVTYRPALSRFSALLERLRPQVAEIIIVDNGSDCDLSPFENDQVAVVRLGENTGLGAAQNHGAGLAIRHDADAILLMDQDSMPATDMVERLVHAWRTLSAADERLAAVGPNYADPNIDHGSPFHRVEGFRTVRPRCSGDHHHHRQCLIPVDHLTASGCLIPIDAWQHNGGMDETLFIDYVDVEWGLRARANGWKCYGVCDARMEHTLGGRPVRVFGRRIVTHPPFRNYYFFRNGLRLIRTAGYPCPWKVAESTRLVLRFAFYAVLGRPRSTHLRQMLRGLRDGWAGRTGRNETTTP
ncbi:glycosyltransferase family 2 protein [Arhodomonas sp. AD133]|uniref:glycosyltransferase family 2 protein n=1 Tax=Arhodomonas sp. AD133 TaxID=3415009 RepID=UPI003EBA2585